jgi:hypothetical protein
VSGDALLERYAWWASLNHGGMLIAPSKLAGRFEETIAPLPETVASRLRRDVLRAQDGGADSVSTFVDTVLEDVVGLHHARWTKGADVAKECSRTSNAGETLKPARVWLGENGARLALFYADTQSGGLRVPKGRGRRAVVRVVEWLRKGTEKIALLATGRQLRLVHAGSDYEAFCEWDTDLWFREGAPGPQVDALRLLLATEALTPPKVGAPSPLLAAIAESRKGQAELSAALGERVRQAVELLIQASGPRLAPLVEASDASRVDERDVYLAATRLVLRCVVVLFAEARELLPRTNPVYEQSYGLQALRVELERQSGGRSAERLRTRYGAWPRLLALFSLMFEGSAHEALPLTRYGGGLFEPGDEASDDPVRRAIAAFEQADVRDTDVQRILELLTRCPTRVRQGRGFTTVQTPVDFSDLGSEYLGILYEGLLDYELKRAGATDAVIFLGVGSEPALPFDLLNRMSNDDLAELLKKLGKATKPSADEEEEEDEAEEDDDEQAEAGEDAAPADESAVVDDSDDRGTIREHVQDWAERAVKAAKLVKYPKKDTDPRARDAFANEVKARGRSLVRRLVLPGDWYLVRWGGTRKGAGTFYTRPQLTGPMVRRALAPLCFDDAVDGNDPRPKKPEEILANRVCDPAMGSGSFLVSALRYLTDALLQSLYVHGRLAQHGERWYIRLADGLPLDDPGQESLPAPKDDDNLDDILRARLKRHVVERCIYGVDLDPLAVELARTALWVETMDYQLPFGFLDHKLKCGNALVGAWLDRFEDYPIRAWDREGGDAKHTNFVHHFRLEKGKKKGDVWTAAIKTHREKVILPELRSELEKLKAEAAGQVVAEFVADGKKAAALHAEALAAFEELHRIIPIYEAAHRAKVYKEKVLQNPSLKALRQALDTWCAIWFWPADKLDLAPTPANLLAPPAETRAEVARLARELRLFHWEVEFPEVMTGPTSGFSAVVGNPPWETQKPNSMEFFSNEDPLYRTYGKQEALKKQKNFFGERAGVEQRWLGYNGRFKALSNWTKYAAYPFGADVSGGEGVAGVDASLARIWADGRVTRPTFADRTHPFQHQGSADINTYKMFLEVAHALLAQGGGLGFLVPSGLYTDNGTQALRNLFFDRCSWTHLYAFQNERFVFEGIHHSFKMVVTHARKGGKTEELRTRFRIGPGDSPESSEIEDDLSDAAAYLVLPLQQIIQFSPNIRSILEVRSRADLQAIATSYERAVLVGSRAHNSWGIESSRELHSTDDSSLLRPTAQLEAEGASRTQYGTWNHPQLGALLPLYEGRLFNAFDFAAKEWVSGTGLRAVWRDSGWDAKNIGPQYCVAVSDLKRHPLYRSRPKLSFRNISRSTDTRSFLATVLARDPTPHVTSNWFTKEPFDSWPVCAIVDSFVFDHVVRARLAGTHLDYYLVAEFPLPPRSPRSLALAPFVLRLANCHIRYAPEWSLFAERQPVFARRSWRSWWARLPHERVRLRSILDAAVAELYGLDLHAFEWVLRECDHPTARVCDKPFSRSLDPKGFWRVDKDKPPELRHSVLSLVAFHELKKLGLESFLALNEGDGWQLPKTLRLADYGLGHDDRAKDHQPVAVALGERFLPWQLGEDVESSWEECRRHAEFIEKSLTVSRSEAAKPAATGSKKPGNGQVGLFDRSPQSALPSMPSFAPTISSPAKEAALIIYALTHAAGGTITRLELARAFAILTKPELLQGLARGSADVSAWADGVTARAIPEGQLRVTLKQLAAGRGVKLSTDSRGQSTVNLGPKTPSEDRLNAWFRIEARLALGVLRALPADAFATVDEAMSVEDRQEAAS